MKMINEGKLSVIVPLYNAGEAFAACIESLVVQTWTELEIIIINDGATDCSLDIARRYAEKYSHIQLISQENGGLSVARNRGLEAATGEFVAFVDADDLTCPDMYETLMTMALQDNLDVAQCNSYWCSSASGKSWQSIPSDSLPTTQVMNGPEWLRKALASGHWRHVVWMGVYRLSLIREINLRFVPGLYHEDIVWTTEFMFNARRVRYTQQPLYKYFLHDNSISRSKRQGGENIRYQWHYIKITRLLEKLNRDYEGRITIYPEFHEQITCEALRVCRAVRKEPDNDIKQIIIADIFASGMYQRMMKNIRSIRMAYQALLWAFRLHLWRDKRAVGKRIFRPPLRWR